MQDFIEWLGLLNAEDLDAQLHEIEGGGLGIANETFEVVHFTGPDNIFEKLKVFKLVGKKEVWQQEVDACFAGWTDADIAGMKNLLTFNAKAITNILREEKRNLESILRSSTLEGLAQEIDGRFETKLRRALRSAAKKRTGGKEAEDDQTIQTKLAAEKENILREAKAKHAVAVPELKAKISALGDGIFKFNSFVLHLGAARLAAKATKATVKVDLDLAPAAVKPAASAAATRHKRRLSQPLNLPALYQEIEKQKQKQKQKPVAIDMQALERQASKAQAVKTQAQAPKTQAAPLPTRNDDWLEDLDVKPYQSAFSDYGDDFDDRFDGDFEPIPHVDSDIEFNYDFDDFGDDIAEDAFITDEQSKKIDQAESYSNSNKKKKNPIAAWQTMPATMPAFNSEKAAPAPVKQAAMSAESVRQAHAARPTLFAQSAEASKPVHKEARKEKLRKKHELALRDDDFSSLNLSYLQAPVPGRKLMGERRLGKAKNTGAGQILAAQQEMRAAERLVAIGISKLHEKFCTPALDFDAQGIATIEVLPEEITKLNLAQYFPLGMTRGVVVHFYRENAVNHPPVQYMGLQKIRALCEAAVTIGVSLDDVSAIYDSLVVNFEKSVSKLPNLIKKPAKIKSFHQEAEKLLAETANRAAKALYDKAKLSVTEYLSEKEEEVAISYDRFVEKLRASKQRAHSQNILTFDAKSGRFSFDEIYPETAASHNPNLNQSTRNLGVAYEGELNPDKIEATITSRLLHHAELSPVEHLPLDENYTVVDLLSTCQHIREVAETMARLRLHGRSAADKDKPIEINWVYQFLGSHLDADPKADSKKAQAYSVLLEAVGLMNGQPLVIEIDGKKIPVNLQVNVFNVGIGKLTDDVHALSEVAQIENDKAYLALTNVLDVALADLPADLIGAVSFNKLKKLLVSIPAGASGIQESDLVLQQENARAFHAAWPVYLADHDQRDQQKKNLQVAAQQQLRTCRLTGKVANKAINNIMKASKSFEKRANEYAEKAAEIRAQRAALVRDLKELINPPLGAYHNIEAVSSMITQYRAGTVAFDRQALLSYAALIYKSYLDELYYTQVKVGGELFTYQYCLPNNAAQFSAYMAAYQRLVGMMASAGGKHGNDSAYIVRVVLAAIEGRPLLALPAPLNCHDDEFSQDHVLFSALVNEAAKINSAQYNTILDTAGGTPKVDANYAVLDNVDNIGFFGKLSAYATHLFDFSPEIKALAGKVIGGGAVGLVLAGGAVLLATGVGAPFGIALLTFFSITIASELIATAIVASVIGVIGFALGAIATRVGLKIATTATSVTTTNTATESNKLLPEPLKTTATVTTVLTATSKSPAKDKPQTMVAHEDDALEAVPPPPPKSPVPIVAAPVKKDDYSASSATHSTSTSPAKDAPKKPDDVIATNADEEALEDVVVEPVIASQTPVTPRRA